MKTGVHNKFSNLNKLRNFILDQKKVDFPLDKAISLGLTNRLELRQRDLDIK